MKKIRNIRIVRMNNGAHFMFASNIQKRAESETILQTKIPKLVSALSEAVAVEDETLNISRKSMLTDDIIEANNERTTLYAGYRNAVKSFLNMPSEDMAEAARVLFQHIKDYRISAKYQLDKKTGLLMNFIDDLEQKYSEQVAALSLTLFVSKMKVANERVRTLTLQRTDERTGIIPGALRKARAATDKAYSELVDMVNALALVFGEADYADFIDYVNTEVVHYKREVLGQKSPTAAAGEEEDSDASDGNNSPTTTDTPAAEGGSTGTDDGYGA